MFERPTRTDLRYLMGCFLACFGSSKDRKHRKRRHKVQPPVHVSSQFFFLILDLLLGFLEAGGNILLTTQDYLVSKFECPVSLRKVGNRLLRGQSMPPCECIYSLSVR